MSESGIAANGGYRDENGVTYVGSWNDERKKHGEGHLLLSDGTRYDGNFENDLFDGLGILNFSDGARYEGEFSQGWFHGYGIFCKANGMRHEGEFRGGKICGLGLTTFNDGTNGFPRHEGFFKECQFKKRMPCSEIVQKAQKVAFMAREKYLPV